MDVVMILYAGLGSGVALAGYALVVLARRPRTPQMLTARCSCGHGYGMHAETARDGVRAECGETSRVRKYSGVRAFFDGLDAFEHRQCPCRCYDGPDPEQIRLLRGA